MVSIVGIDSRSFVRDVVKTDRTKGHFESVIGMAVKVADYIKFKEQYIKAIKSSSKYLICENDLQFYCFNDIKNCKTSYDFLESFFKEISPHLEKIHVFYTLFCELPRVSLCAQPVASRLSYAA